MSTSSSSCRSCCARRSAKPRPAVQPPRCIWSWLASTARASPNRRADLDVVIEDNFCPRYPALRPEPAPALVRQAAASAARPNGRSLWPAAARGHPTRAPELIEFAEKLAIPVATSLNSKDHPRRSSSWRLASPGLPARLRRPRPPRVRSSRFSSAAIPVGRSPSWMLPPSARQLIQLISTPPSSGAITRRVGPRRRQATLRRWSRQPGASPKTARTEVGRPAARRVAPAETSEMRDRRLPIRPERIKESSDASAARQPGVSDTGHAGIWTARYIDFSLPGQSYLRSAGSLGWGFPAAMGVKCPCPARPVLCFTGDGGFWYHLSELETARRCGIHTPSPS